MALPRTNAENNLALGGELDGVPQQVNDHLAQPGGIANHEVSGAVRYVKDHLETLLMGLQREGAGRLAQALLKGELNALQLDAACLDF